MSFFLVFFISQKPWLSSWLYSLSSGGNGCGHVFGTATHSFLKVQQATYPRTEPETGGRRGVGGNSHQVASWPPLDSLVCSLLKRAHPRGVLRGGQRGGQSSSRGPNGWGQEEEASRPAPPAGSQGPGSAHCGGCPQSHRVFSRTHEMPVANPPPGLWQPRMSPDPARRLLGTNPQTQPG